MFREKDVKVADRVEDMVTVTGRLVKREGEPVKKKMERKAETEKERLMMRRGMSPEKPKFKNFRKNSVKSRFLAALNRKQHHETE